VAFLKRLGDESVYRASSRHAVNGVVEAIYETPGLLQEFASGIRSRVLTDPLPIAWLLTVITRIRPEERRKTSVQTLSSLFFEYYAAMPETQELAVMVQRFIGEGCEASLTINMIEETLPCHDNDFPSDFRRIEIVPTVEELNTDEASPRVASKRDTVDSNLELEADIVTAAKVNEVLDRQFRLLRHDMVASIQQDFRDQLKKESSRRRRFFSGTEIEGVTDHPPTDPQTGRPRSNHSNSYFLVRFGVPKWLEEKTKGFSLEKLAEFYKDGAGKRVMSKDSIVLFLEKSETGAKVCHVGIVVSREPAGPMFSESTPGCVHVGISLMSSGRPLRIFNSSGSFAWRLGDMAFQSSAPLFYYRPILDRLHEISWIPFTKEFLLLKTAQCTASKIELPKSVYDKLVADPQQLEAAEFAMNNSVTLIQGPPGTGKTFVGVQIARALLASSAEVGFPVKILCLCYTNHALDDFLQSIVADGFPKSGIKRLGKSPKMSEDMKSCSLNDILVPFTGSQRKRFRQLQVLIHDSTNHMQQRWNECNALPYAWSTMKEFLASEDPDAHDALTTPDNIVGRKGKADRDYYWDRWRRGESAPTAALNCCGVWTLSHPERVQQLQEWAEKYDSDNLESLDECMESRDNFLSMLRELKNEQKIDQLETAQVSGCRF
jgi:hypothetical protein